MYRVSYLFAHPMLAAKAPRGLKGRISIMDGMIRERCLTTGKTNADLSIEGL